MQASSEARRAGGDRPDLVVLVALTLAYFLGGRLGLSFATIHASASAIWPPTAIALAALLLFGYRAWPAIFAGAFLVNVTTSGSLLVSTAIAVGNTAEGLVGAYLVGRFARGPACFERVADVFRFAGLAAGAATMTSATIGVLALVLAGQAGWEAFERIWLTWWLGDATGALIFAPPIVLWFRDRSLRVPDGRLAEVALTTALVMGIGALCFASPVLSGYPLMFLCMPPLAWVAFRFGRRAVTTHVALLALIAIYTTEHGVGPFVMATRNESLLVLQAFMGTIALMMLPIAALVGQYERATAALEAANAQERRARAEAEAASGAKDEFLAMLSHELRNPLQAISSSIWLMDRPAPAGGESRGRALEILRRQTEHLTRLVNDLLDVARLSAGKIAIQPQAVNLADAIRRNVNALEVAGRLEDHTVEVEAESLWLRVDPARLDQMLANLVANALKYTPQGGTIRVGAHTEGADAVVRVRDDGVGIAPELLPRVFDLFTQGDRGLDRREGGLGVGLALVQRLARLHGGSVEARSDGTGRGSEFVLRLPVAAHAIGGATPEPAQRLVEPRRVLIVEDHADVRTALRTLLEHEGHIVYEAEDGASGIDAALRWRPDVVLIDIGLPRIDGYQVAQTLRSRQDTIGARLRLVAVTGYGQPEDKRRARNAGFDEHLVKPVDPAALQRALGEAVAAATDVSQAG
jgi:signal transduction histidine kinase/ActR/RegA family two-component response regulator